MKYLKILFIFLITGIVLLSSIRSVYAEISDDSSNIANITILTPGLGLHSLVELGWI